MQTESLRNEELPEDKRVAAVKDLGRFSVTDGMIFDKWQPVPGRLPEPQKW